MLKNKESNSIIGNKYNMLTVISKKPRNKGEKQLFICLCDCGNTKEVLKIDLKLSKVKSCGCLKIKTSSLLNRTHGLSEHKLYSVWSSMKGRCLNKKDKRYFDYGGRGISVCEEWRKDFLSFYNWSIKNGYSEGLTLDRINNDGNYEPNNCRYVSYKVQSTNTRETPRSSVLQRNISLYNNKYYVRIYRDGVWRRALKKDLDEAIKLRDVWIKEYNENPEKWVLNTTLNNFNKNIQ